MTIETLMQANSLAKQIASKKEFLTKLTSQQIVVTIAYGRKDLTPQTITTIGVEANSEHDLYDAGRSFIDTLIIYTKKEIESLEAEFEALK